MGKPSSREALEDRIYELRGENKTISEIAEILGMTREETAPLVEKVLEERGVPQLVAARQALDRLADIRF